jgi:hypothetical protein
MRVRGRKDKDGNDLVIPDDLSYAEMLKVLGGGMATCGGHLGVMVSTVENISRCPPGWAFVDVNDSAEVVQEAIDFIYRGRKGWPAKEDGSQPQ